MLNKIILFLLFALSLFYFSNAHAAYFSADLKDAIKYDCKKKVKEKKFPNKKECEKSLQLTLEAEGVVSVKKVPDLEMQKRIETLCVYEIKVGALEYNECIYKEVNKSLGIEPVDPPVLVKNQEETGEDKDEKAPPVEIPMPLNVIDAVYSKVKETTFFVWRWEFDSSKEDWIPSGSGSAVHLGDGLLVTNCHVVTSMCETIPKEINDYNSIYNQCNETKIEIDIISITENASDLKSEKWFRDVNVIKEDQNLDRCIIETSDPKFNYPAADIKYFKELRLHDTVYAIGSPRRFTGKPTEGKITMLYEHIPPGLHEITNFSMMGLDMEYIETDAPVDKGNSGGGLFSDEGELIGVPSLCEILGGAEQCWMEDGEEMCVPYCNITSPQNWSIPIERFIELM